MRFDINDNGYKFVSHSLINFLSDLSDLIESEGEKC